MQAGLLFTYSLILFLGIALMLVGVKNILSVWERPIGKCWGVASRASFLIVVACGHFVYVLYSVSHA